MADVRILDTAAGKANLNKITLIILVTYLYLFLFNKHQRAIIARIIHVLNVPTQQIYF
jgi:hypothetical protein